MTLNGQTLSSLDLTPLRGAIDNLYGTMTIKSLKFNDNAQMDGSRAITTNKKVKRRDNIAFPCYLKAATRDEFMQKLNTLYTALSNGVQGSGNNFTGVNELVDGSTTFRLVCTGYSSLKSWNNGSGTVNFIFTELNPKNRSL